MYEQICSLKFVTTLPKYAGDSEHVVTPRAGALLGEMVEIEFKIAGKLFGMDHDLPVWPWGDRHIGRETDRRRHDEAVVVVGVFADKVDASGGAEDPGSIVEGSLEALNEFVDLHQRVAQFCIFSWKLRRTLRLVDIKIEVMTEARQRNLISAGHVETESARGEIGSRQRPPVEDEPRIPLLDLVDDFRRGHMNLQCAKAFLFTLVGNLRVARLLTLADVGPIEIVFVDLE